ncbi:MAG: protease inhibitor I42 family protein [Lautropia sp.]
MARRRTGRRIASDGAAGTLAAALLAAALAAGCAGRGEQRPPDPVPAAAFGVVKVFESHSGQSIQLEVGQILEVWLRAYPAQGIEIKLGSVLAPTLSQHGKPRYLDESEWRQVANSPFPHEVWQFRAERPGAVKLRLDYRRQWETIGPAARSAVYDVTVR